MKVTARHVSQLVFQLLGKRRRRTAIVWRWHAVQPVKGANMADVIHTFFKVLLYQPIVFQMSQLGIHLWPDHHGLVIRYEWLTRGERAMAKAMFNERRALFGHVQFAENGDFMLAKLRQGPPAVGAWLSLEQRRELVRDFVYMCLMQKPRRAQELRYSMYHAVQRLAVEPVHGRVDPWLASLQRVLDHACLPNQWVTHDFGQSEMSHHE